VLLLAFSREYLRNCYEVQAKCLTRTQTNRLRKNTSPESASDQPVGIVEAEAVIAELASIFLKFPPSCSSPLLGRRDW
jgi:hypothetical protein